MNLINHSTVFILHKLTSFITVLAKQNKTNAYIRKNTNCKLHIEAHSLPIKVNWCQKNYYTDILF